MTKNLMGEDSGCVKQILRSCAIIKFKVFLIVRSFELKIKKRKTMIVELTVSIMNIPIIRNESIKVNKNSRFRKMCY